MLLDGPLASLPILDQRVCPFAANLYRFLVI